MTLMNSTRRTFITQSIGLVTISAAALNSQQQGTLLKSMDVIIPAGDGMPSASAAGGMTYLEKLMQREPTIADQIGNCLNALENIAFRLFQKPFDKLSNEEAVSAMTHFENESPAELATLRDYVYESYYTQPPVWKLIDYEFYPTDYPGPHMKPFDDSVLDPVRSKPKLYRDDGDGQL